MNPFKCAIDGNVKFFEEVELDIIQNWRDSEDGDSVLSLAAMAGQLNCCQVIYKRCPELLYETNEIKATALHYAAYYGRDNVIKFLLSARGEEEDSETVQEDIETGGSVKQYVDYKLLMMVDSYLDTALHSASERGKIQSTKLLLRADPSNKLLTMLNCDRNTALHSAVQNKHLEIVRLLLEKDPGFVYSANKSGHTPFSIASEAATSGDPISVAIRELLVYPFECAIAGNVKFFEEVELDIIQNWRDSEDGDSVLSLAAMAGQLNCCQVIYKRCPELLYETNEIKATALHYAAYYGRDNVIKFLLSARGEEEDSETVQEDIETGGSVKQYVDYKLLMMVDSYLDTALHSASERGKIQSTKLLLRADPSNKLLTMLNCDRNTALHSAVQNKHLEIVRLLLEKDPGFVYSANKSGHTPFSIASEAATSGDPISVAIRELLVYPFECAIAGNVKFFEEVELDIIQNWRDSEDGDSVLSLAAMAGQLNCCQVIYKRCPELLYETNEIKATALHYAAYYGRDNVIKFLLSARGEEEDSETVQEDIETGGSVKQYVDYKLLMMVDSYLDTALHSASERGEIQSTKLLLQADPSNKLLTMLNCDRNTALHSAVQSKHLEIVRLLLEKDPGFVYSANKSGHTPFSIASEAATSGDPISVAIRDLLTVNNTIRSKVSIDPLECLRKGHGGFFEEVELNIIENWRDEDGCSILSRAARIGQLNCCQVIYRRCPQLLYEPNNGKDEVVKFLLSARGEEEDSEVVRGNIETRGRLQQYVNYKLLMMVGKGGDSALHSASKMGRVQSAKLLLQADPSNKLFKMKNVGKSTAMHYAVKFQQLGIVKLLMETDPDFVYSRDNSGYTPHFKALQELKSNLKPTKSESQNHNTPPILLQNTCN